MPKFSWLVKALATTILVVLVPLSLFSETTVKQLVDNWLNSCLIVIEKSPISARRIEVRAFASGKLPSRLPLTFRAPDVLIDSVRFTSADDPVEHSSFANLGLHPDDEQTCPGALCVGQRLGSGSEPIANIVLTDLSETFAYRFILDMHQVASEKDLDVFVIFDSGLKDGVCRVESANFFNFLIRASKLTRFWVFLAFILLLTIAISAFNRLKEVSQ